MIKNYLLDKNFLSSLDEHYEKEVWAKIIALDINENPVEEITGRVSGGGSINIDGSSSVRRSCSVSMIAEDVNINDFYWGLHSKFKVLVGLTNNINTNYPDIIWFPQGVYIITSFSTSQGINNYNISIQGKDKMCLLNGEVGGSLTAPIDFGKIEERDKEGNLTITDIPIKDIIMEGVHEYAKEPWHNIIINDLDDLGIELLDYKGSKPLFLFIDEKADRVRNMTLNAEQKCCISGTNDILSIGALGNGYNQLTEGYPGDKSNYYKVHLVNNGVIDYNNTYSVAKVEYGQTAGYRLTDIIYPGDLIANQGDSFTSILDKLVKMLGNFEYFYDTDGRFIFQMKKTYLQKTWNNLVKTTDKDVIANIESTPFGYEFKSGALTINFSNSPNFGSLKNDFSIWGSRKSVTGAEIPIHLRYAIDKKPYYYKSPYTNKIYTTREDIFNLEIDKLKADAVAIVGKKILDFQMTNGLGSTGLQAPTKNADGSWTPGWWNIKDWYEFYYLLQQEYPNRTMKWYSQDAIEGAPLVSSIPNFDNKISSGYLREGYRCWLIIDTGSSYNLGHGASDRTDLYSTQSICQYSYIDANGDIQTQPVPGVEPKYFSYPFAICSDRHTYLQFIKDYVDEGQSVYFYNPKFPAVDSFKEIVEKRVEAEFKDMLESGAVQRCDWREIIYQMAKDYRKHNHDDDFLIQIRDSNKFNEEYLYPSGYTGYEQYYIDLEGFWRQLYNPDYNIDSPSLGGDGPIEKLIEVNDVGLFNECNSTEVYTYPYIVLSDRDAWGAEDAEGNKKYTADNTFVITKLSNDGKYDVKPFIHKDFCAPQEEITYYKYYNRSEQATAISFDVAKDSVLSTLYVEVVEEDGEIILERWVDIQYTNFTNSEARKRCSKSTISKKVIEIEDLFIRDMYVEMENGVAKRFYPHTYTKIMRHDNETFYFNKEKIEYYFTTYNYFEKGESYQFWNRNVLEAPDLLNFWFDFMDTDGEMNKYAVSVIGNRPKVINDSAIKSIYFRETPTVIFVNTKKVAGWELTERKDGYTYIQLPESMLTLFNISSQGKSAYDVLQESIYNDTYCLESVSMTTIPIYYLQPNTRIYIRNDDSKIDGEYIVSRFTIPLDYSGTMSISATKLADRIN